MTLTRLPLLAALLCALTLPSFAPVAAAAPAAQTSRAATDRDLSGLWKQAAIVPLSEGIDVSNPWFGGTQYWLFLGSGQMKTMVVDGNAPELSKAQLKDWEASPSSWSYKLDYRGVSWLKHTDESKTYLVRFEFYTADYDTSKLPREVAKKNARLLPHRGDVAVTYYNQDSKPLFFRLLRRYTPTK